MKGQLKTQFSRIVVLSAAVLVILLVWGGFQGLMAQESKDSQCKISVLQVITTGNTDLLKCPALKNVIEQKHFERNLAKAMIADRMAACWENFGNGDHKPFDKDVVGRGDIICKKCDTIIFADDVRASTLTGFRSFLETTESARFGYYAEFLYSGFEDYYPMVPDELDTTETYYTYYQVFKPDIIGPEDLNLGFLAKERVESAIWLISDSDFKVGKLGCRHEFD